MLSRILGKKIGMTQIFADKGKVIPVTVIDVSNWFVTQIKKFDKDGYSALQVGLLKKRYRSASLESNWLKNKKKYFSYLREISISKDDIEKFKLGQKVKLENVSFKEDDKVCVSGISKGLGFQGVVKRWGFGGGPDSHGSQFHRIPGAVGNIRSQGEVIKGKKLPGHAGCKRLTIKNLKIVLFDRDGGYLFVKGAVPGKKDSLVIIAQQG